MEQTSKSLSFQILELIKTKEEAFLFMEEIRKLNEVLFNVNTNNEHALEENVSFANKEKFATLFQSNNISTKDPMQTQNFLSLLKTTVEKIPVLNIIIAFEPKEETIQNISDWFLLKLKKEVLLEITVDKNIIGGAVITNNGLYKNYSLKKKIEERYKNQDGKSY